MFSRTTIASSINKPIAKDSAISVIKLMVKPIKEIAHIAPIKDTGKVKPVITVERHVPKNKNTINTVNNTPSIKVSRTSFTELRMSSDWS